MEETTLARQLCRAGKEAFFHHDEDPQKRQLGLQLLLQAKDEGDPEACYLVAKLILDGVLTVQGEDYVEHAAYLMICAADRGWIQARAWLNLHCMARYARQFPQDRMPAGPLVDFDGVPITIDRTGLWTPVDAVLTWENGENVLTLSTNVHFLYATEPEAPDAFEQAVLQGFQAWSGHYTVFGGQQLRVRVELSLEDKFFDRLTVVPVDAQLNATMRATGAFLGNRQVEALAADQRSFATMGRRWSANSRKTIWLQGPLDDPVRISQIAKHEFGHVLGLGDLYESPSDGLTGVQEGTYPELDSYAVTDKLYHLVMCTGAGPVSNNDVEMVVLAFRENRAQLYQPGNLKGVISQALGKGN